MIAVSDAWLDHGGEVLACECGGALERRDGERAIPEVGTYPWGTCSRCGRAWTVIQDVTWQGEAGCSVLVADDPAAAS